MRKICIGAGCIFFSRFFSCKHKQFRRIWTPNKIFATSHHEVLRRIKFFLEIFRFRNIIENIGKNVIVFSFVPKRSQCLMIEGLYKFCAVVSGKSAYLSFPRIFSLTTLPNYHIWRNNNIICIADRIKILPDKPLSLKYKVWDSVA